MQKTDDSKKSKTSNTKSVKLSKRSTTGGPLAKSVGPNAGPTKQKQIPRTIHVNGPTGKLTVTSILDANNRPKIIHAVHIPRPVGNVKGISKQPSVKWTRILAPSLRYPHPARITQLITQQGRGYAGRGLEETQKIMVKPRFLEGSSNVRGVVYDPQKYYMNNGAPVNSSDSIGSFANDAKMSGDFNQCTINTKSFQGAVDVLTTNTVGDELLRFNIDPTTWFNTPVGAIAPLFAFMVLKNFKIHYSTLSPTTVSGGIVVVWVPDPNKTLSKGNAGLGEALQSQSAIDIPLWKDGHLDIDVPKDWMKYVSSSGLSDAKFSSYGYVSVIASGSFSSSITAGLITVETTFDFKSLTIANDSIIGTGMWFESAHAASTATLTTALPFGEEDRTVWVSNSNLNVSYTGLSDGPYGKFYVPAGYYFYIMDLNTTGGAPALSFSAGTGYGAAVSIIQGPSTLVLSTTDLVSYVTLFVDPGFAMSDQWFAGHITGATAVTSSSARIIRAPMWQYGVWAIKDHIPALCNHGKNQVMERMASRLAALELKETIRDEEEQSDESDSDSSIKQTIMMQKHTKLSKNKKTPFVQL